MRHLHPHGRASDFDVFVAPVELVRLAGLELQRDERRGAPQDIGASILAPRRLPARRIAAHRIVGAFEALAQQQVVDPRHPQAITPWQTFVLYQQRVQTLLERPNPQQRLHRPVIGEGTLRCADRLAHNLA